MVQGICFFLPLCQWFPHSPTDDDTMQTFSAGVQLFRATEHKTVDYWHHHYMSLQLCRRDRQWYRLESVHGRQDSKSGKQNYVFILSKIYWHNHLVYIQHPRHSFGSRSYLHHVKCSNPEWYNIRPGQSLPGKLPINLYLCQFMRLLQPKCYGYHKKIIGILLSLS